MHTERAWDVTQADAEPARMAVPGDLRLCAACRACVRNPDLATAERSPEGWHALLMSSGTGRDLLRQVLCEVVGDAAQVEWVEPGGGWSAHARVRGTCGRVSHLLTSPEIQEARFEEPECMVVILTSPDEGEAQEALAKLARAALEYSAGGGHVEHKKGVLGTRPILVLHTTDGEWRIGKRSGSIPY